MSKSINDKRNTLSEILNLSSGVNHCERIVKTKLDTKFKLDLKTGMDSCKTELEPDKCEEIVKTKLDNKYQIDLKHVMNLCKDKYINTNILRSSRLASEKKAVDSAIQMSVDANDNLSESFANATDSSRSPSPLAPQLQRASDINIDIEGHRRPRMGSKAADLESVTPVKDYEEKGGTKKRVTKKRVYKKRVTKKRVYKKRVTKKRVTKKRVTKKRVTKKRVTKKRVTKKRVTKTPSLPLRSLVAHLRLRSTPWAANRSKL